jgi:hypothetical protein
LRPAAPGGILFACFFFYLRPSIPLGICVLLICLGGWLFWIVKSRRTLIRVPVRIGSLFLVPLIAIAGLLIGLVSFSGNSEPIYSPDRNHAIRVEDMDEGGTGGEATAVLFSEHGLRWDTIFVGEWKGVEAKDIHWISNDTVLISYYSQQGPYVCASARGIAVRCERGLEPAH